MKADGLKEIPIMGNTLPNIDQELPQTLNSPLVERVTGQTLLRLEPLSNGNRIMVLQPFMQGKQQTGTQRGV
ncbi:MAG TPA: hypothetical protein PLM62_06470 [Zoogloea sp.]|nr:hypothetical protein [Zoogloea sp.]